jgi:hypothetical protein
MSEERIEFELKRTTKGAPYIEVKGYPLQFMFSSSDWNCRPPWNWVSISNVVTVSYKERRVQQNKTTMTTLGLSPIPKDIKGDEPAAIYPHLKEILRRVAKDRMLREENIPMLEEALSKGLVVRTRKKAKRKE